MGTDPTRPTPPHAPAETLVVPGGWQIEGRDGAGALPARGEAGDEGVIRAVEVRMLPTPAIEAPSTTS